MKGGIFQPSNFYQVIAAKFPFLFIMAARASKQRWAATTAAGMYTAIMLFMIWVLPLFHAQPKLAPIYTPVDHMVPPPFPMLLIVPAFAIDCLVQWFGAKGSVFQTLWWKQLLKGSLLVLSVAVSFLALALPIQWFFSRFLLSPAADNWFFVGQKVWPYYTQPGPWH